MRRTITVITLGLAIGTGLGLTAGWFWPVNTAKTTPQVLSADWQADWVLMTAQAYSLDGDLDQARQRLELLGPGEPGQRVAQRGERAISEGLPPAYVGALARLAAALGTRPASLAPYLSK